MRKVLFHVAQHPDAIIEASVDPAFVQGLKPGQSATHNVDARLSLAGRDHAVKTTLMVTRLTDSRFMVQPVHMLMLDAGDYGLAGGIDTLREIAGLTSISTAVPVDFVFTFQRR